MAADYFILKRRAQEDEKLSYEAFTRKDFKAACTAEWEIKSTEQIEQQKLMSRFNAIRQHDRSALDMRRRKLANMLQEEQVYFQQQLEQLDESPTECRQRMEHRAKELKDKRESERMAFVQQQYERQWRLACDPLREQESKAILRATNAARAYQIEEKMKMLESEEQETRKFDEMWESDRLAKLGREEAEEAARRQMDEEHKSVLDQQVNELHGYRSAEIELSGQEAELLKQQRDMESDEANKVESLRRKVHEDAAKELHLFNQHKRTQLRSAAEVERNEDRARLAAVLQKETEEEELEAASQQYMKEETVRFAEHMLAQKREAQSYEAQLELLRKKELDKAWDKRLQVWGQEQEARERLMAQVLHERTAQVGRKLQDVQISKHNEADARRTLESELERVTSIQEAKLEQSRQIRMDHRSLLESQIRDKAFNKAADAYDKTQERLSAERAEAQYQAMLNHQMDKTESFMNKFSK